MTKTPLPPAPTPAEPDQPEDKSRRDFLLPKSLRAFLDGLMETEGSGAASAEGDKIDRREFLKRGGAAAVMANLPEIPSAKTPAAGVIAKAVAKKDTVRILLPVTPLSRLRKCFDARRMEQFLEKAFGSLDEDLAYHMRLISEANTRVVDDIISSKGTEVAEQALKTLKAEVDRLSYFNSLTYDRYYREVSQEQLRRGKAVIPRTNEELSQYQMEAHRDAWKTFSDQLMDVLRKELERKEIKHIEPASLHPLAHAASLGNIGIKWEPATKKLHFIRPDLDAMDMGSELLQGKITKKEARRALMRQFEDMLCQYDPELTSKITHGSASGLVVKQPPEDLLKILGIDPAQPYRSESGLSR